MGSVPNMKMKAQDARNILLQSGIQHFRLKAGYIPPQLQPEDIVNIDMTFAHSWILIADYWTYDADGFWDKLVPVGEVHGITVSIKLCDKCRDNLNDCFHTIHFSNGTGLETDICKICGDEYDTIPF